MNIFNKEQEIIFWRQNTPTSSWEKVSESKIIMWSIPLYIRLHVSGLKTNFIYTYIYIGETKNVSYNVEFTIDKCIMKEKKLAK